LKTFVSRDLLYVGSSELVNRILKYGKDTVFCCPAYN